LKLSITILIAIKNEARNLPQCLKATLGRATRVLVLDSHSTDGSAEIALDAGTEVVQFNYAGGYPKKRQWALSTLEIQTDWVLLLDADEVVSPELWDEISDAISAPHAAEAFLITKGFHFLGQRFRYGGFSFSAVLLFRRGKARFERLVEDNAAALDMEVHERVIVDGSVGKLRTPLIHDDFKGLEAYIDRHNKYSTWEAKLRHTYLTSGQYGESSVKPRLFGNSQERRRWLKKIAIRMPLEPWLWFLYHYVLKLGFLEGRRGYIASQIRSQYISQVRAKMYEMSQPRRAH
jgi:glycosyltransferase involved in cell wall biosynthesis